MDHRKSGGGSGGGHRQCKPVGAPVLLVCSLTVSFLTISTLFVNRESVAGGALRSHFHSLPQELVQRTRSSLEHGMVSLLDDNRGPLIPSLELALLAADAKAAHTIATDRLLHEVNRLKNVVHDMRIRKKLVMPRDPRALAMTAQLQAATRCYLSMVYGEIDRRMILAMELEFPEEMLAAHQWLRQEQDAGKGHITLFIETAPMTLLPHATFTVLEIAKTYRKGSFHRNADHVLQSQISCGFRGGLVFMEYDRSYRHEKYSLGFAGRGGGNALYINTANNTMTHGPGTDRGGKDPESDTVFGKVLAAGAARSRGKKIVDLMRKQPGGEKPNGFINNPKYFIHIRGFTPLTSSMDWERYGLINNLVAGVKEAGYFVPQDVYYDSFLHNRSNTHPIDRREGIESSRDGVNIAMTAIMSKKHAQCQSLVTSAKIVP